MSFSIPCVSSSNLTCTVGPVSTDTLGHVAGTLLEPQLQAIVGQQSPLKTGAGLVVNGDFKSPRDRNTWFKGDLLTWDVLGLCALFSPPRPELDFEGGGVEEGELSLAKVLSSWNLALRVLGMVNPR